MVNGCSYHVKPLGITDNAVLDSFILFFTLFVLWAVELSKTYSVFILSWKWIFSPYFSYYFSIISSLFHTFSCQNTKNSFFLSAHSICSNFHYLSFPSFALKIHKGASFSPYTIIIKIGAIFSFLVLVF